MRALFSASFVCFSYMNGANQDFMFVHAFLFSGLGALQIDFHNAVAFPGVSCYTLLRSHI